MSKAIMFIELIQKFNSKHDKNGRFASKSGGFTSRKSLDYHYEKHKDEYPNISKKEYAEIAKNLLNSDDESGKIQSYLRIRGYIVKYDNSTNDFLVGTPDGKVVSMFRPRQGKRYYENDKRKFEMETNSD